MTVIRFKSSGHDAEKELGHVAMFSDGIGDHRELWKLSCYFFPEVAIGSLEMLSMGFLLSILYDFISIDHFIYILAPFALIYFLSSTASLAVYYHMDDYVKFSGYVSKCLNQISAWRLGSLVIVFGAKCALIYVYSKTLIDIVHASESLYALTSIYIENPLNAENVPTNHFILTLVCICIIIVFDTGLIISRIRPADPASHIYALVLSLVDKRAISIFFLIHRVLEQQKEVVHFNNIITTLPILLMAVAAARCFVWFFIPFIFAEQNDRRCVNQFGLIHLGVAITHTVFYVRKDFGMLLTLKMVCFTAIAERFLMMVINVYLGYRSRQTFLLKFKDALRHPDRIHRYKNSQSSNHPQWSAAGSADPDDGRPLPAQQSPHSSPQHSPSRLNHGNRVSWLSSSLPSSTASEKRDNHQRLYDGGPMQASGDGRPLLSIHQLIDGYSSSVDPKARDMDESFLPNAPRDALASLQAEMRQLQMRITEKQERLKTIKSELKKLRLNLNILQKKKLDPLEEELKGLCDIVEASEKTDEKTARRIRQIEDELRELNVRKERDLEPLIPYIQEEATIQREIEALRKEMEALSMQMKASQRKS